MRVEESESEELGDEQLFLLIASSAHPVLQNLKSINLSSTETSGYPLHFDDRGDRQQEPVLVKVVKGSDGLFKFEQVN